MLNFRGKLGQLYTLEHLASGQSVIHALHPLAKLLGVFTFLLCVVSLDRYALGRTLPYLPLLAVVLLLAELPVSLIVKRAAALLPLVFVAGLFNLLFDRTPLLQVAGFTVTTGLLSVVVILLRTLLCVGAAVILVSVTPFHLLTGELRRLRVPAVLLTVMEMTYRYLSLLVEEASTMRAAYHLRHPTAKGIEMRDMGTFIAQWLLRSVDRAGRIYQAMQCRGYGGKARPAHIIPWRTADTLFLLGFAGGSLLLRLFDLPFLLGRLAQGGG